MTDHVDDERKAREREFHDHRFTEETRGAADKFYAIDAGKARYRSLVRERDAVRRVLEYGCGVGSEALDLAASGDEVSGIDISRVAIAKSRDEASARSLAAEFHQMDAEALTFDNGSFDLVCGSGILHHLDLERAYREVARVLDQGGVGIFMEPLGHNPLINLYRRLTPRMRTSDEHPLLMGDLELAKRWFGSVDVEFFDLTSLAAVPLRKFPGGGQALRLLQRVDAWLFRHFRVARRWAWIVVIRLSEPISGSPRPDVDEIGGADPGPQA